MARIGPEGFLPTFLRVCLHLQIQIAEGPVVPGVGDQCALPRIPPGIFPAGQDPPAVLERVDHFPETRRTPGRYGIAAAQDQIPRPVRYRDCRIAQPDFQAGRDKEAVFPPALSQEHFQQDDPEAPEIGGGSHFFFLMLFRGCIGSRTESDCGIRSRAPQEGQAEIRDFGGAVPGKKNVGRLQIPVNETPAVGIGHAAGNLYPDIENLFLSRQDICPCALICSRTFICLRAVIWLCAVIWLRAVVSLLAVICLLAFI